LKKICVVCNKKKNIKNFEFKKDTKKYRPQCKECIKIQRKKYYSMLENYKKLQKSWLNYTANSKNHKKRLEYYNKYNNMEKNKKRRKKIKNKEKQKINDKKYYYNTKNNISKHKQKLEKHVKRIKKRLEEKPYLKLHSNISSYIYKSLKKNKNNKKSEHILKYTFNDLKQHLESQFEDWMNWNNYGKQIRDYKNKKWNIDHIIPVSCYKIKNYNSLNFKKCWNLKNLRPLCAVKNNEKKNKINYELIKKYNIHHLLPKKYIIYYILYNIKTKIIREIKNYDKHKSCNMS